MPDKATPPPTWPALCDPAVESASPTCGSIPTWTPTCEAWPAGWPASPTTAHRAQAIVTRAGLIVTHVELHDQALLDTIDRVTTRPRALRLVDLLILRRFNLERGI
jgi:hypothetical protein